MRPVVQLHTIEQWLQIDPTVRSLILQHIRLKDRLEKWLMLRNGKAPTTTAEWRRCARCSDSQYPGFVLKEPRAPGIHPSQLASNCLLKIYWEMEGREQRERHDARSHLIFDIGHVVHHMFQDFGRQGAWGERYWPESRLTGTRQALADELFIEGAADAENILVVDTVPNAPIFEVGVIHEYKTIKKKNFDKLTRPKPEHQQQATVYSKILNRPVTVYLYMCKDDQVMADFPVQYDPAAWQSIEDKARMLVGHFDREEPPPATPGYHCNECVFFYGCQAGQASQRAAMAARR